MLDRAEELAEFDRALAETVAGEGRVLVIEGPPGIGKTALLTELRQRARSAELTVLTARAGELEHGFAFGIVRQLLDGPLATADVRERERLLAGAARLAEPVFGRAADPGQEEGAEAAYATLHGLYWLVVNLAETAPLVLAVDDMQWVDEPSLRFLLHLAHRLASMPMLLALTVRPGPEVNGAVLRSLLLEARPVLRPPPLGAAAVHDLVRSTLGAEAGVDLARACRETTGGNPFLLSEVLGELRRTPEPVGRIDPRSVRRLAPDRVAAAVLLRVGQLGPQAPALARAVAVLSEHARLTDSARLAGIESRTARVAAEALADLAVLQRGEPLRFVHPIVRSAIYEDIPHFGRAELHAAAARLLIDRGEDPAAVAVHLLAADPAGDRDVVRILRRAARRALSRGAPEVARDLLRRALAEPPDPEDHPELLLELGHAEHEGGVPDAPGHLRQAAEIAGDVLTRARALIALAWATHTNAPLQRELLAAYEAAAAEVSPIDRELGLHLEAARLGGLLFNTDLPFRFEAAAERFDSLTGNTAAECTVLSFVARKALADGTVVEAADLAERAAAHPGLTGQGGHPLWRQNTTYCLMAAERYNMVDQILTDAMRSAERSGSPQWYARAATLRAVTRCWAGDLRGAEADSKAAYEARGLGYSFMRHTVLLPAIVSLAAQGRVTDGQALLDRRDVELDELPLLPSTWYLYARGQLRIAGGDLAAARIDLGETLRRLGATRWLVPLQHDTRVALAAVLLGLGEIERARSVADEALRAATAARSRRGIGGALRVAGLARPGKDGLDLLRRAVDTLAESPSAVWHAEALVDYGTALRRDGQSTTARQVLSHGMDLANRCGAIPLADRAADELRALGARPRRRATTGADALTASERRVAELAASGMRNKEIAQSLFVTLRTVELHLSNAYGKLAIHSRDSLATALDSSR